MKKSEKYQLLCLIITAVNVIMLAITNNSDYFISANIFAASVFVIGALDK
jgi:hypothetical protein